MLRRVPLAALPLGFLLAVVLAACGSGGSSDRASGLTPPPARTQAPAPATTSTETVATTGTTTTAPAATTTTSTGPAPSSRSSGGATTTEPSGGAPAGCPSAVGGFIRDVRATNCDVARSVASAWFGAVHGGARPDGTIVAAGYTCGATMRGERASVACRAPSGGSVSFTASP